MNWRRGLIRLWLVGSVLWVVAVGWLTWSDGITYFFWHAYTTVTDPGGKDHAREAWHAKLHENTRPWRAAKARILANHDLQPPSSMGDFGIGIFPGDWWEDNTLCEEVIGRGVTPAECEELKRVAAAIPVLPEPVGAQEWSAEPLLDWSGLVFLPPIAPLLIAIALTWALRGSLGI
jgi:hypothetical protein